MTEARKLQDLLDVEQIYFPLFARWSFMIEIFCLVAFSLELILRIISAPSFLLIQSDLFNLLDFVRIDFHRHLIADLLWLDRHFFQCDESDWLSFAKHPSNYELSLHLLLVVNLEILSSLSASSVSVTSAITLSRDESVPE